MIAIKQKEPFMQTKMQAAESIEADMKSGVQQEPQTGGPEQPGQRCDSGMTGEGPEAGWRLKESGFGNEKSPATVRQSPYGGVPLLHRAITPLPISSRGLPRFPIAGCGEALDKLDHQQSDSPSRLEPLSEELCNPDLMRFSWRRSLFFIAIASGSLWAAIIFGVSAILP